jgi:hypothetical protein
MFMHVFNVREFLSFSQFEWCHIILSYEQFPQPKHLIRRCHFAKHVIKKGIHSLGPVVQLILVVTDVNAKPKVTHSVMIAKLK